MGYFPGMEHFLPPAVVGVQVGGGSPSSASAQRNRATGAWTGRDTWNETRAHKGVPYEVNTTGPGYRYNGHVYQDEASLHQQIETDHAAGSFPNAPSQAQSSAAQNTFSQYLSSLGKGPDTESLNKELQGSFGLLDQSQARDLNSLRDALGQQQEGNVQDLRAQLAQRGLLDSGSLGAGTANIGNEISRQLAQGYSSSAAQKEAREAEMIQTALNRNLQRQTAVAKMSQDAWEMIQKLGLSYDQLHQSDQQFLSSLGASRDQLSQQADQFNQQLAFNQDKAKKDREQSMWNALIGIAPDVGKGAAQIHF